jgi:hypothetical protein
MQICVTGPQCVNKSSEMEIIGYNIETVQNVAHNLPDKFQQPVASVVVSMGPNIFHLF